MFSQVDLGVCDIVGCMTCTGFGTHRHISISILWGYPSLIGLPFTGVYMLVCCFGALLEVLCGDHEAEFPAALFLVCSQGPISLATLILKVSTRKIKAVSAELAHNIP